MGVLSFVERLKSGLSKAKAETGRWDDYREIMQAVIDDRSVDPFECESILQAVGRSFDDLEKDAEVFRKRLASRAAIDAVGDAREQARKVSGRAEQLSRERAEYLERVNAELRSLREQESALLFTINASVSAESELRSSIQDPAVRFAMEQANNRVKELVAKEQRLIELTTLSSSPDSIPGKLSLIRSKLDDWKATPPSNGESLEYIRKQITGLEAQQVAWQTRLEETERELRAVRAEMVQAQREQAEADKRTLIP